MLQNVGTSNKIMRLADEPIGNLDLKTAPLIMKLLKRLDYNIGTTVIIVNHDKKMTLLQKKKIILKDRRISNMYMKKRIQNIA